MRVGRTASVALASLTALALVAGCSSSGSDSSKADSGAAGTDAPAESVFPGATWATASPASLGLDGKELDRIAADAKAGGSDCFAVIRHGKVAGSWNWHGTDETSAQEAFSVTKSFTSILTGMAQGDGDLKITDKASKYIPEWKGTPSDAITVEHLLSNDSGRHWDFQTDYYKMTGSPDRTKLARSLAQDSPPGKIWVYNNSAIQMLSQVFLAATGEEASDYAEKRLFAPIGMDHSEITKDEAGHTAMFLGLQSTCADMARFGLLMLRQGKWDGKQVVPADWVEAATSRPSQKLNAAYGYLFWLNRKGRLPVEATQATKPGETQQDFTTGQKHPEAPDDMFWALGLGDQIIQMDPGTDTVVVRMGPAQPEDATQSFNEINTIQVVTDAVTDGSN